MRTLKESDLKGFIELLKLDQKNLHRFMNEYLRKFYSKVITTRDYICAEGEIPIALVAHMDTVFDVPCQHIYYDAKKQVMFSPDGLGADDRAGVFSIIQILRSGLRPHIILTTDEEKGGLGALRLANYPCPFKELNYIIELDRRGVADCVFYDCENYDFIEYVEKFGFVLEYGSFSDISWICPQWKVAGVNLSVGYQNEHTRYETLSVSAMLATIDKVKTMLREIEIPKFEYVASEWSKKYCGLVTPYYYGYEEIPCQHCKRYFLEEEMIPVISKDKKTIFYCPDCVVDRVNWCQKCGEAFETENKDEALCPDCKTKTEEKDNVLSRNPKSVQ